MLNFGDFYKNFCTMFYTTKRYSTNSFSINEVMVYLMLISIITKVIIENSAR